MARRRTKAGAAGSPADLAEYRSKRKFDKTPEPGPERKSSRSGRSFVIQKHRASQLHYDFRLEVDGVLKSWAVPKGPSVNPGVKRLAMAVEDHPLDYAGFEGVIPEGEYGGGTVMIWDKGTYTPENGSGAVASDIARGELKFSLNGKKLGGSWVLVRTRDRQWLLIKHRDAFASDEPVTDTRARSVVSDRTLAEIAAEEGGNVAKAATGDPDLASGEHKKRATRKKRASPKSDPHPSRSAAPGAETEIPGRAVKAGFPKAVQPMLATLVDEPFSDDEWIYETKWDGVRTLCYLNQGKYRLASRRISDVTAKYPELSAIAQAIKADQALLDGEIVALDAEGIPRFQLLQPRFGLKPGSGSGGKLKGTLAYYVFDLLYLDGYDLTEVPLIERKRLLQRIIAKGPAVRYSDHIVGKGIEFFKEIKKLQLEGMIAKRGDSVYVQKRSQNWLKVKTVQRSEVVIGGYTQPRGSRSHFGSLVVGLYDGPPSKKKLKYAGHTGGGFNEQSLRRVYKLMQPLKVENSPFASPVKTNEPVQWIEPKLVCEVKFSEWTHDGIMRMPIFVGLRDDKDPKQCVAERKLSTEEMVQEAHTGSDEPSKSRSTPVTASRAEPASILTSGDLEGDLKVKAPGGLVKLTNLDKVYWPRDGYTKGDVLRYYYQMARYILPYLKDRPLILKRYPDGIEQPAFHQHTVVNPPDFVDTFVRQRDGEEVTYAIANNVAALLYVANLGSITMHPWSARRQTPEKPDWILFDLDPGDAPFKQVLEVGVLLHEQLERLGLKSYPKTSGSKGIHVYVPIKNAYTHDQVVRFATLVARATAAERPDLITIERTVRKRAAGRVYLDYLQNGFGKSLAGPYSLRARPHAAVSAPVKWVEVEDGKLKPDSFTIVNMQERLDDVGDLFDPARRQRQGLGRAIKRLEKALRSTK